MTPVLLFLAVAAAPPPTPTPDRRPITVTGHAWAPFISPMGEPFRARSPVDDTLANWFRQADRNHDGVLTADELQADADRFFTELDTNRDGEIDPEELVSYEWEVAPDIQLMSKTKRLPGDPAVRKPRTDDDPLEAATRLGTSHDNGTEPGGLQGAARYALLNIPEPVASADVDFNRGVSAGEFRAAAVRRFQMLDEQHSGQLTLSQLEILRAAKLADHRSRPRRNDPDRRVGNSLPAGN
jgi:hypothetical protein